MNANDITLGQRGDGEYVVSIWENDVEVYTGFGRTASDALRDLADVVEEAARESEGNAKKDEPITDD